MRATDRKTGNGGIVLKDIFLLPLYGLSCHIHAGSKNKCLKWLQIFFAMMVKWK
jgi:hypothetical protein